MSFNPHLNISKSLFSSEETSDDYGIFGIKMLNEFARDVLKFNTHI